MTIDRNDIVFTLSEIRQKVRDLSGRPSVNQITDDAIDKYINRFYTINLPNILDTRAFDGFWEFNTIKKVTKYGLDRDILSLGNIAYVDGNEIVIDKDPGTFFSKYPKQYQSQSTSIGTGDGSTTAFTGTLNQTVLKNDTFVATDTVEVFTPQEILYITNISQASPAVVTTETAHGLTTGDRVLLDQLQNGMSEVDNVASTVTVLSTTTFELDDVDSTNYESYKLGGIVTPLSVILLTGTLGGSGRITTGSGAFTVTFNSAPSDGQAITCSYEAEQMGEPEAALFYGTELHFRPIPNSSYDVQIPATIAPKEILNDTDAIVDSSLAKLIAYGAAMDLLNDKGQQDASAVISLEYRALLAQANNKFVRSMTNQRAKPGF